MSNVNWQERVLGMFAVEKRFITEKQLTKLLNTIEFFESDKTLVEVMLSKGYLTKNQIKRLNQEFEAATQVTQSEAGIQKMFGDLAIEQSMITEEQLFEALDVQDSYLERGLRVQIGQILSKKGYVTIAQVKRIVESQLKKVFICGKCENTRVVTSYIAGGIYQCESCQLDMIEAKIQKPSVSIDDDLEEDDYEDEEDDMGLDIIEL